MNDPLVHDGTDNTSQLKSRPRVDADTGDPAPQDKSEPSSVSIADSNAESELIDAEIRIAEAKLKLEQPRQKKLKYVSGPRK